MSQKLRSFVTKRLAHLKKGERISPPNDRQPDELDAVVEGVIDALRAEWRLYPDIYAWMVSEAVREHLAASGPVPETDSGEEQR